MRREADEVFEVPSFLDIEAIVSVAKRARADLPHPGYGYLSENPAFANAVAHCLDHALRYARQREQFGQPIVGFQAVGRPGPPPRIGADRSGVAASRLRDGRG